MAKKAGNKDNGGFLAEMANILSKKPACKIGPKF